MKIILILTLLPLCYGTLCPKGEYWSTFSEICLKCTQCKSHQIMIRACQSYKDTICSTIIESYNHNNLDINSNSNNNNKIHHFEKNKLHFITDNDDNDSEVILDNTILEMDMKHDKHHKKHKLKKQRINDKFLKWDDTDDEDNDEDYDYNHEINKHKKHKIASSKLNHHKEHKHYSFTDNLDEEEIGDDDDDEEESNYGNDNDLDSILDNKKWKIKENKNAARLAQLEDEKKLEEWLIQSRKQFKDRKDNLLKTLKEEKLDNYENDKRIRLNYPLFNINNRFSNSFKYNNNNDDKTVSKTQKKHNVESEVELFKELIKDEESQEMELATLMSNKKDTPIHYKTVTPTHRMYLGAPSDDIGLLSGHIRDPQEVIKEEMGRNIIYEKSKFSVVPIIRNDKDTEIISVPFTTAETLVWDWQAVAVVSAIISCLLFFLVIGTFVLFNGKQFRKEKHSYNQESEEMSTRVALIQPSLETSAADANNTNKFLQQFLSLNEDPFKEKISPENTKELRENH